ncbi:ArsR family transcriptional regulator [Micromonospora sp. HM5-17]|nr:ArsR family transcriptional regulator [Micromonospora sp. HM5-17]
MHQGRCRCQDGGVENADVGQGAESRVLAAMSHPLRRRLLDVLEAEGPATVSVLAERTGQAVANVSHHLRVLGAAGLIEAAPDLARTSRERWWRLVPRRVRWSRRDDAGDPAARVVADAATALNLERQIGVVRAWYAAGDDAHAAWGKGPFSTDRWLRLTPEELAELEQELQELLARWENRKIPEDGRRREPVLFFAYGIPAQP